MPVASYRRSYSAGFETGRETPRVDILHQPPSLMNERSGGRSRDVAEYAIHDMLQARRSEAPWAGWAVLKAGGPSCQKLHR
jgi:hypothetical protein